LNCILKKEVSRRFIMRKCLVGVLLAILAGAQPEERPALLHSTREDTLKRFLQEYISQEHLDDHKTTRYSRAFVDLDGDGKEEAIVYLAGRWWCGSGGCPTLILKPEHSSYRLVTNISITRPPIGVLSNTSNGWHNISVWVQGGGIQPGYQAELRFDGKSYPENPSIPPARPLEGKVAGRIIMRSSQIGMSLYP
jgi:hypothetical protein